MSDNQFAELYERLMAAKSKRATENRLFLRGWNACIDFILKQMKLVEDKQMEAAE